MNNWISDVDLVIVFDLGDFNRLGEIAKQIKYNQTVISPICSGGISLQRQLKR